MSISKISAYVHTARQEAVEQKLLEMGVPGFSCYEVTGRGQYTNLYKADGMTHHTCIELFIGTERATEVAESIMNVAHTGVSGDGIVAIEKISALYKIETRSLCEDA